MGKFVRVVLFAAGIVFFFVSSDSLKAQTVTGTILGNVADASGAAVPNAEVTVTNQDTGVARSVTSTADGIYNMPSLLAGKYMVEAKAQGFTVQQVKDVVLNVGSNARVDFTLQVGQITQQVTVTEALPTVETTSSEVSQVMDATLIDAVPLNARDLQQLALIQPGVTMVYTGSYGHTLSVGGDRISNNRFLTEGIDVSLFSKQSPVSLASFNMMGADAVKEFKVITDNPPGSLAGTLFSSASRAGSGTTTWKTTCRIHAAPIRFQISGNFWPEVPQIASAGGSMVIQIRSMARPIPRPSLAERACTPWAYMAKTRSSSAQI